MVHYYSADYVDSEYAEEFHLGLDTLNKVRVSGVPDHDLIIKMVASAW